MPTSGSSDHLFEALREAGIPRSYVKRMLPDWWTDELLGDPNARLELDINLSRMFGLKLSNLLQDRPSITIDLPGGAKYKRSKRVGEGDLAQATAMVYSIAKMVAAATTTEVVDLPTDPAAVRQGILAMGPKWVSLMAVVQYLWAHGIPVIHVKEMPAGLKKMDGLALRVGSRPVIVLCKRTPFSAWHLFIVAHELAHCALGHIGENEVLVDCTVGEESYLLGEGEDPEEFAADTLAIETLNGGPVRYTSSERANSAQLAKAAMDWQKAHQVDAGHVILNYGHWNDAWAVAQAALGLIDKQDAPARLNAFLFDHLDLGLLPEASAEYLLKVAGAEVPTGAEGGVE